ncbi:hypothetical protein [Gemmata sp. SH-PL17]|uniref:hypothetical protein n=1 Tax=Gemmata sp. SH-PL17 TaxID=1630693 RepID=UPI0009ED2D68|nr:hypothetical protein [Gemmata sp. SH-PL17]
MSVAADLEKLTLEVVDSKTGKVLRTVENVEATRAENGTGFVVKNNTLRTEKPEVGWRLIDANKVTWTISKATRGGQGERWVLTCEKKKP